jgi:cyclopropane-fatty-acyl-phospholipid synthase
MSSSIALSKPKKKFHDRVAELFSCADVEINGQRPWDIHIHNDDFYARVLRSGTLGLGESYMDGWWDTDQLDEFICKLLRGDLRNKIKAIDDLILSLQAKFTNLQNPTRAYEVGEHHYDIGNDLYECMLDKRMIYSCAYWQNAANLDEAQKAKLDLICRKLELKPGMKVLDIGCGWGGTARFAAENYGVEVVGISISKEQVSLAKEHCKGLPIEIRLQDYRSLDEKFDRILSIGMFEHVGYKNYRTFMKKAHSLLNENSLFLLHTIGSNKTKRTGDSWMNKYIKFHAALCQTGYTGI